MCSVLLGYNNNNNKIIIHAVITLSVLRNFHSRFQGEESIKNDRLLPISICIVFSFLAVIQ